MKEIEKMSITEMMEELRRRREYDENLDSNMEELGEKFALLEQEVIVLRALLSRTIVGIMIGPKFVEPEA